jgi:BirA family biotin operon repressor/biotin-[acetyl-CoA-carboxylase] ligase
VVIGIGMNLTWPGPPEAEGTSLLSCSGVAVDREALLVQLLVELGERLELLESHEGRAEVLAELTASLVTLGQDVAVSTSDGVVTGRATRLSPQGHLVVATTAGEVEIATGDVQQLRTS